MTPKIEDALNKLSATLTTDVLKKLNKKVEVNKADPEEVATKYLQRKDLDE
jgi:osmoprotectant transport system substrate-binding protein